MSFDPPASAPHARTTFTCSMPSAAALAAQRERLTQAMFCTYLQSLWSDQSILSLAASLGKLGS